MNINKYYKILNCNINDDITIIKKILEDYY